MLQFAEVLPAIRAKVDEDLGLSGLARDRVLATVVRLLELTLIRVGNEEYARCIAGTDITAKDFRTWAGTVLAANALLALASDTPTKKNITEAVRSVASRLGNTPRVCRKCYVHPGVFGAYVEGQLVSALQPRASDGTREQVASLSSAEAAVLGLLRERLAGRKPKPNKMPARRHAA